MKKSSLNFNGNSIEIVSVDLNRCDYCDACNGVCPTNAIIVNEKKWSLNEPACIGCRKCVNSCPVDALFMVIK